MQLPGHFVMASLCFFGVECCMRCEMICVAGDRGRWCLSVPTISCICGPCVRRDRKSYIHSSYNENGKLNHQYLQATQLSLSSIHPGRSQDLEGIWKGKGRAPQGRPVHPPPTAMTAPPPSSPPFPLPPPPLFPFPPSPSVRSRTP